MTPDAQGKGRTIIIGVGNEFRGDDAFGFEVVRRLSPDLPPHIDTMMTEGDGVTLMQSWAGYDVVIVVDCVTSGSPAGTQFCFDVREKRMPAQFFRSSSHLFGVAEAVEMARTLNQLPTRLLVFGAEGIQFELGGGFSPEVAAAIDKTVAAIRSVLV